MLRFAFLILFCALLVISCRKIQRTASSVQSPARNRILVAQPRPLIMPLDSLHAAYRGLRWSHEVNYIYQSRRGECFWFSPEAGSAALRDSLYKTLGTVRYLGLRAEDYHSAELELQTSDSVRLEALLTDSFLSLVHDVKYGHCYAKENHPMDARVLENIRSGVELAEYVRSGEPAFTGYRALKDALRNSIDSLTHEAENLPHQKLRVIQLNLDRWRKLPLPEEQSYILVNIPAFMLYAVDHDSVVIQSKIIVGKPESPTPELVGTIDRITINPYWYVPRKIAVEEYLPLLQSDTSFLTDNNFDVLDRTGNLLVSDSIDWKQVTPHTFRVVLRQRKGPGNSLGIYKFVFDNPFAIYLHDTNARWLFSKTNRSFSHGCIRVAQAESLAHYLATGSLQERSVKIKAAVASGETQTIYLPKPVMIYISYFTVEGANGKFREYKDLYHCDSTDQ